MRPAEHRWARAAATAVVVALLAGCGDGAGDEGTGPTTTVRPTDVGGACDLLDDDEVGELVGPGASGELSEDLSATAEMGFSLCRWTGEGDVELTVAVIESADRFHDRRDLLRTRHEDEGAPPPVALAGPGDDGYTVAVEAGRGRQAAVVFGDRTLEVTMVSDRGVRSATVADVATEVFPRVPSS